jgi:hypothetical protein
MQHVPLLVVTSCRHFRKALLPACESLITSL